MSIASPLIALTATVVIGVILFTAGLMLLPALALGPIVERLAH